MRVLNEGGDPEAFFASLQGAPESCLMPGYDGTLAPFRAERDQAFPIPVSGRCWKGSLKGEGRAW